MVVTVVKIESRSFSSAEIQHFRTEIRGVIIYENSYDLYVIYRYLTIIRRRRSDYR